MSTKSPLTLAQAEGYVRDVLLLELRYDAHDLLHVLSVEGLVPRRVVAYGESVPDALRSLAAQLEGNHPPQRARPVRTRRTKGGT